MTWKSGVGAGVVVGMCGVVAAAGTVAVSESRVTVAADASLAKEPLESVRFACAPVQAAKGVDASVAGITVPGLPGQGGAGALRLTALSEKGQAKATKAAGAQLELTTLPTATSGLVAADGGLAPGALGASVMFDHSAESMGLSSAPCRSAVSENWLVGGGAGDGQRDTLTLMNPTRTDTIVDIQAFAQGGELALTGDEGIVVPARTFRAVRLDALSPDTPQMVLHVTTRVGLINATVTDDRMDGLTPKGVDVIADAGQPARTVVTGAVPAGPGNRTLVLLSPGQDANVKLTAMTADGDTPLLNGDAQSFKGDHARTIDLTGALGGKAAAVRIDSDVPLVANLSASTAAPKGVQDLAWVGTSDPIRATTAVTGLRADLTSSVVLTAADGDATATVTVLPGGKGKTVTVSSGHATAIPLSGPKGGVFTAEVTRTAGTGELRVSHLQVGPNGALTGYALPPLALSRMLPAVTSQVAP